MVETKRESYQLIKNLRGKYLKNEKVSWAIIPAAGSGTRVGTNIPKQYQVIGSKTVLELSVDALLAMPSSAKLVVIIVVLSKKDSYFPFYFEEGKFVKYGSVQPVLALKIGEDSRSGSVFSGLKFLKKFAAEDDWVWIHDSARPGLNPYLVEKLWNEGSESAVGGILAVSASDTLKMQKEYLPSKKDNIEIEKTIDRKLCWHAQTPQLFKYGLLFEGLSRFRDATDESSAIESLGYSPLLVKGNSLNFKITNKTDLDIFRSMHMSQRDKGQHQLRIGQGFDTHKFIADRKLILGGVQIDFPMGLEGHSDADVLIHAVCDGILGAACMGDLGDWFPNTDKSLKNVDSRKLLRQIISEIREKSLSVFQIDCTLICEKPKISPYKTQIRELLKLDTNATHVNVKGTTTEKLGFLGRAEGIAALAYVSLKVD